MSKTWKIIKLMFKMQYSRVGKEKNNNALIYAFLLIFLIPFFFYYINFIETITETLYSSLKPLGQESLILGLLFLIIHFLLFFVSIAGVLNSFYFAEDIESFIPFPLQPFQILLGKAAIPFLYLYLTTAAVFLPAYIYFGIFSASNLIYYIYGIVFFVLLPVIPFVLASIPLMFVMRFANISRNKDRTKVLVGILSFGLIILINVWIRLNSNANNVYGNITNFIQEKDGLLHMITSLYPPASFSTKAMIFSSGFTGLLFFVLMLAITVGLFILFIVVGQLVYFKGVLGINAGNKKQIPMKKLTKKIKQRPIWLTYFQKELRIIFRTPTFLMQCVVYCLFGPIFITIILMLDYNTSSGFSEIYSMFTDKQLILLMVLVTVFIISSNPTAFTSISRDGKSFQANLFLPISIKQLFLYKIAVAWIINLLSVLLIFFLFTFLFKFPFISVCFWLGLTLLANWATSVIGTYLDFDRPKLNWTDEQEIFKARLIGLIALVFEVVPLGFIVLIVWNLPFVQGYLIPALIMLVWIVVSVVIAHRLIGKKIASGDEQNL